MGQRIAYLGPAGTFSEDALLAAAADAAIEPLPRPSVQRRSARWSRARPIGRCVPFENSIEGSVRSTLDALAFDAAGGGDRRRARPPDPPQPDRRAPSSSSSAIEVVLSHPQASAQCARFLREELPQAPGPRRGQHRRRGARWWPSPTSRGPRSAPPRPRGSTAASCCARASRTTTGQRHPVRLDRPGRDPSRPARARGGRPWSSPSSAPTTPGRSSRR